MIVPIDKITNQKALDNAINRYKEKGIILPTFAQQKNPELIPEKIKDKLRNIGLWDFDPLNLFRITWKNEPKDFGGLYGEPNFEKEWRFDSEEDFEIMVWNFAKKIVIAGRIAGTGWDNKK